jgi:hypothetical protein
MSAEHCTCGNTWPLLPAGVTGQQIRYRKVFNPPMVDVPVRVGGAEPKVIVTESRTFVIYETFSAKDGKSLGEHVAPRAQFEEHFERKES